MNFEAEKERIADIAAKLGLPLHGDDTFPLITLIEETARRLVLVEGKLRTFDSESGALSRPYVSDSQGKLPFPDAVLNVVGFPVQGQHLTIIDGKAVEASPYRRGT